MIRSIFAVLFLVLTSATAWALESPFSNLDQIISNTRISSLLQSNTPRQHVRIAILDNGFRNFELEIGKTLPTATTFQVGPVVVPETQLENHGTAMSQIVAGMLDRGSNGNFTYDLILYSAFGYSNFSSAVNDAIAKKVDVILYSQVWEYGGFGAGSGFINEVVNRATASGILWINAAGNFAKGTYQSRVIASSDGWAKLPAQNDSIRIRCEKKCRMRMVLSWNDFSNDVNIGTDKDLDLVLSDDTLRIVKTSALTQKKDFPENQPGMSKYPREIIETELEPGTSSVPLRSLPVS